MYSNSAELAVPGWTELRCPDGRTYLTVPGWTNIGHGTETGQIEFTMPRRMNMLILLLSSYVSGGE